MYVAIVRPRKYFIWRLFPDADAFIVRQNVLSPRFISPIFISFYSILFAGRARKKRGINRVGTNRTRSIPAHLPPLVCIIVCVCVCVRTKARWNYFVGISAGTVSIISSRSRLTGRDVLYGPGTMYRMCYVPGKVGRSYAVASTNTCRWIF